MRRASKSGFGSRRNKILNRDNLNYRAERKVFFNGLI